jgi:hypothetical protein
MYTIVSHTLKLPMMFGLAFAIPMKLSHEKPSGLYHGLICNEQLTCIGLNLNMGNFVVLPYYLFHVEKHICLSHDV